MQSKREANRADLRNRLIEAAEARIAADGLRGLKARDVTADAGCALGALYNVVEDLDQLIILVNSRTLARLGEALRASISEEATPPEKMQALGKAYVDFVLSNRKHWSAVFFHRLSTDAEVPDWHKQEHAVLIDNLIEPLAQMRPDLSPSALRVRAGTLFSAVHGVVQLSLHGRFVGTPPELLASEVRALIDAMSRGTHLAVPEQ
ncbi:MAG: TetR-like C-terminal domain-containing protein [Pseudorhodobacter sp.]|jgi:AcrR family transcriptional regulator|nr:TetR-like C-terminal domain-containing protein [Pseudorhodobacter sp.]